MKKMSRCHVLHQHIDPAKVVELRLAALEQDPDCFGEKLREALMRSEDDWSVWFAARTGNRNRIFVLESGGRYVGMCGVFWRDDPDAGSYLWGAYVQPDHRKKGLARHLVSRVLDYIGSDGIPSVGLRIEKSNTRAFEFFRSLGFRDVGSKTAVTEMKLTPR
jgi:ribosomal protein S18 acetylase RimI-like enzyme